jgi:hypothetical protein
MLNVNPLFSLDRLNRSMPSASSAQDGDCHIFNTNDAIKKDVKIELIECIFSKLNNMSLVNASRVNKEWNQIADRIIQKRKAKRTTGKAKANQESAVKFDPNNDGSKVKVGILTGLLDNFFKKKYEEALWFLVQIESEGGRGWALSSLVKMSDDRQLAFTLAKAITDPHWNAYTLEWISNNADRFVNL